MIKEFSCKVNKKNTFAVNYFEFMKQIILSTTDTMPNKEIVEILGIARGSNVRTRNLGRDIIAFLKHIVGGEIEEYTYLQAEASEQAMQRMYADAEKTKR